MNKINSSIGVPEDDIEEIFSKYDVDEDFTLDENEKRKMLLELKNEQVIYFYESFCYPGKNFQIIVLIISYKYFKIIVKIVFKFVKRMV